MHYLLSVELTEDNLPLVGFPYVRAFEAADHQPWDYLAPSTPIVAYRTAPPTRLAEIDGAVFWTDKAICVRLNGQIDGEIVLDAGGLLALWDCVLDDSPVSNLEISRTDTPAGTGAARVRGIAIGSDLYATPVPSGPGFGGGGFDGP
jgi:hypothetical protein